MTFLNLTTLFGGLALFIYGVELMSSGMQNIAGSRLRKMLGVVVKHKSAGLIIGVFITLLFQSSSASTVLFVSLVQSGVLVFKDTIALILGAMIGTTLTVQLIAFKITNYALIAVVAGVILRITGKYERQKQWANMLLGIGLIFFGMSVMKTGVEPLKNSPAFENYLRFALGSPWLSFLAATIFTAVVQASAATIALIFSFAAAGMLGTAPNEVLINSLPFILGANLGTTVTALLASINTDRAALRCAVAHTVLKLFAAVTFMFLIIPVSNLTLIITDFFWKKDLSAERAIANSHTLFNLITVAVCLPITALISRLFILIIPEKKSQNIFPELSFQNNKSIDFKIEYENIIQAVSKLSKMTSKTAIEISSQFSIININKLEVIAANDNKIDRAFKEIKNHAMLVYRFPGFQKERDNLIWLIRTSELLERLADDFARSIIRDLRKMNNKDIVFSLENSADLTNICAETGRLLQKLSEVFISKNSSELNDIIINIKSLHSQIKSMRLSHFQAVSNNVPKAIESSNYFLDMLSELESSLSKLKALTKLASKNFIEFS